MQIETDKPQTIGRYVLLEERGRGGLGRVFAAYDPQLARRVAVKVLLAQPTDEDGPARLLREARAAAKVNHPNVVGVYDSGEDNGQVYIAMELVEGVTLSTWLKIEERGWTDIKDAFSQAAEGLAAAHAQGLVHRDFKPSNVIVGDDHRVRVVDFGLAVAVGERPSGPRAKSPDIDPTAVRVTATGSIVGTPAYLAPEQLSAEEAGPAADQFSFCVALFEALFVERPYTATSLDEREAEIRRGPPKIPRVSTVPAWVGPIIQRGLQPDPRQRFGSMRELLAALQRKSRSRYIVAGVAAAAALSVAAIFVARQPPATPTPVASAAPSELAALKHEARAAAAQASWVYPPPDAPASATAYTKVVEIEALELAAGADLRSEFAAALARLGDEFWEREGGELFAADFYAQALVFEPEHPRALERASLTTAQVATFAKRAKNGAWSEEELLAAQTVAVVAEKDPAERRRKLEALYRRPRPPSTVQTARLECLLHPEERDVVAQALDRSEPGDPTEAAAPPAEQSEPAAEPKATDSGTKTAEPGPDRAKAKALVASAKRALAAGKWREAEQLFHKAIDSNPREGAALGGLAELHFERGQNPKAIRFARQAIRVSPKRADHRLLLGDAYQKIYEYAKAREQYEAAAKLGSAAATKRLQRLAARTGEND